VGVWVCGCVCVCVCVCVQSGNIASHIQIPWVKHTAMLPCGRAFNSHYCFMYLVGGRWGMAYHSQARHYLLLQPWWWFQWPTVHPSRRWEVVMPINVSHNQQKQDQGIGTPHSTTQFQVINASGMTLCTVAMYLHLLGSSLDFCCNFLNYSRILLGHWSYALLVKIIL